MGIMFNILKITAMAVVAVTARPLFSMKEKALPKVKKCKAVLSTKETANTS